VYVPAIPLHDSVEVPELPRIMLVGLSMHERPVDGDVVVASVIVPVSPCKAGRAVTVIVDDPASPALSVRVGVLATTVKSWIV